MTLNFAHRGFSGRYPENTMLAFQKALETHCDGIELDTHLTRDGELVVIHDESVDRTTNGTGLVKDMDYAALRRLDAGNGERIPTLDEYFDLVEKTRIVTNIEMKNSVFRYDGMEEKVIKKVRERRLEEKVIFSSFNHFSMVQCGELAPEIKRGFLVWSWYIDVGAYAKKHGMYSINPEYNSLTDEAVKEIHSRGVKIYAYTPNERREFESLISREVDCIITNEPALLDETLGRR
jgi:glycerophosphoryl diester phosphodiesterase